ncbi:MAG: DnaJ domain-containing protein [Synergistaceae bacterium]|nr:DnaJ domain-containing protein [Synergistaceae bacterium]
MIEERNYLYRILGLRPGASLVDIKAAYRRLTKLYHPDRDQSLDTEIMYKEIRIAYEKLMNWNCESGKYVKAETKTGLKTSTVRSHSSSDNTWTSENRATEYYDRRINNPFELKHPISVFFSSLKELSIIDIFTGIVAFGIACFPAIEEPYANLVFSYHIVSWILFVFFRYYFAPSEWSFIMRIFAAILYGSILSFLIFCFYVTPIDGTWTAAVLSTWFLMVQPPDTGRRL